MKALLSFSHVPDNELLAETVRLAGHERSATIKLICALAEIDKRQLYLTEGCSSLYVYCRRVLKLSEHAAYRRMLAAKKGREYPIVLRMLARGEITLTTVVLLAPHLTAENHIALLREARGKTKREVEAMVARMSPRPPVETVVTELAPGIYMLQCSLTQQEHDDLRFGQEQLRHIMPAADPARVIGRALGIQARELRRSRFAETVRPRKPGLRHANTRHIPAHVVREVFKRDGHRCAYIGRLGRCDERNYLELHHVKPFAAGGEATAANLQLRCRAHNKHESEVYFRAAGVFHNSRRSE